MKGAPVTAVLTDRPNMLRPEMKSPTAVPAALIETMANKAAAREAAQCSSIVEAHVMRAEVADHGAQRARNEHADPVAEVRLGS
jgi:hypothetical protein